MSHSRRQVVGGAGAASVQPASRSNRGSFVLTILANYYERLIRSMPLCVFAWTAGNSLGGCADSGKCMRHSDCMPEARCVRGSCIAPLSFDLAGMAGSITSYAGYAGTVSTDATADAKGGAGGAVLVIGGAGGARMSSSASGGASGSGNRLELSGNAGLGVAGSGSGVAASAGST